MSRKWKALYILTAIFLIYGTINNLMPLIDKRTANEEVIATLASQTDPLGSKAQRQEIHSQAEQLSRRSREMEKVIPSRMGNAEMIRQISEAAERHGLQQKSIKESWEQQMPDEKDVGPKSLRTTQIVWAGYGGHQDIMAFLNEIESSVRLCQIISIMMSRRADEAEPHKPEAHFDITFHLRSFCF